MKVLSIETDPELRQVIIESGRLTLQAELRGSWRSKPYWNHHERSHGGYELRLFWGLVNLSLDYWGRFLP